MPCARLVSISPAQVGPWPLSSVAGGILAPVFHNRQVGACGSCVRLGTKSLGLKGLGLLAFGSLLASEACYGERLFSSLWEGTE